MMRPWEWIEEDLLKLIGQPESIRLEFKSSSLFSTSPDKIKEKLSKSISALANSEGGTIVIGIKEKKISKSYYADSLDEGVEIAKYSAEWLQRILVSNISPYLPGIRVRAVPLSGKEGRVAFVVFVPDGVTVYQASDKRYYCRSEYEVYPMADHEIRLKMMKSQKPQMNIEVINLNLLSAEKEYSERQKSLKYEIEVLTIITPERRKFLEAPKRDFDELTFQFKIRNSSEITIKDFLLEIRVDSELNILYSNSILKNSDKLQFKFVETKRIFKSSMFDTTTAESK